MEKIKRPGKVTNKKDLEGIGEKRTLVNNIPRRKANWIGHKVSKLKTVKRYKYSLVLVV